MSKPGPILFVSHDAARTGAPMLLLHFLRWLKSQNSVPFEVLLVRGGELQSEFEAVAPVWTLQTGSRPLGLAGRARRKMILTRLRHRNFDLVYSNTITNGHILRVLARPGRTIVTHVHELETMIKRYGQANFENVARFTHRYVACAEAVKENLIKHHALTPDMIDVVHEFIDLGPLGSERFEADRAIELAKIGVPAGVRVVGCSGTTDWRKGPDLFVQLAHACNGINTGVPIHFVWVGGDASGTPRFDELDHDVTGLGLRGLVHFLGARPDAVELFSLFDVFALVSREDPFPLVCLEAASQHVPIVCFDGAGGEKEFVRQDCGIVVPYLDIATMAARIVEILESDDLRKEMGRHAAARVRDQHTVSVSAPKILESIKKGYAAGRVRTT